MPRASAGFPANVSARFLDVAAQARLTLAGKREGGGFWRMPHGAHFVRLCWCNNIDLARRSRPVLP